MVRTFNFGPNQKNNYSVIQIVNLIKKDWKNIKWEFKKREKVYETNILKLDSSNPLNY